MDSVSITRLSARYRFSGGADGARERLDRILLESVRSGLEPALEAAGVSLGEEVCLRRVRTEIGLHLSDGDTRLGRSWVLSMAEAIRQAIATPGPDVVRYRSRHHALVDLLEGAAACTLARTWAWRQLGLWKIGDDAGPVVAAEEALRALAAEPRAAVAVLATVARKGRLDALLRRARPEAWAAVARAVLAETGAPPALAEVQPALAGTMPPPNGPAPALPPGSTGVLPDPAQGVPTPSRPASASPPPAERVFRRSAIGLTAAAAPRAVAHPVTRRALAVLAALEAEPGALRRSGADLLVTELDERLALGGAGALSEAPAVPTTSGRASEAEEAPPSALRTGAVTAAGGLLFLLNDLNALGLPDALLADERVSDRPLRWVLHRLALALSPLDPKDPAALAFCGLGPEAEPPSHGEAEPTSAESQAIEDARTQVVDVLCARLRRPGEADETLLAWLVARKAEVVADPGWMEVRFSLGDVSTEIRRCGLDLDPGWIPWLGVVMRFVYV